MEAAEVERIVAVWQDRLGLSRWNIKVRWELPCELSSDAEIRISDDYEQASLRIQQQEDPATEPPTEPFTKWSDVMANRVVVHELLHIFEKQTRRPVEAYLPEKPKLADDLFWSWYEHGAENWIDRLAIILVDLAGCA